MAAASLALLVLRVGDLERARRFYVALGMEFAAERHGDGPEHLSCSLGGTVVELYPATAATPADPGTRLGFRVPSVDNAVAALAPEGAVVLSGPAESPWGRRAVVSDPDGRRVEITEG
jgi:catechol 2,3-dioxygenase-like lactoylglutathione lyase family enzyme